MQTQTIVIAGGGFAGTTLAKALEKRLPEGWQVVLVSEESYTTFNPMLAEVVGAAVFPEHVVAPIREMLPKTRVIMGQVQRIDTVQRSVTCSVDRPPSPPAASRGRGARARHVRRRREHSRRQPAACAARS